MSSPLLRAVLDTNIVVSAILRRNGLEADIFRRSLRGELRLYTSEPILKEYGAVLQRPKFGFSKAVLQRVIQDLESACIVVTLAGQITASPDPEDNMFLECAESAHADYLVTGNLRHFPSNWKGTRIVSSRQFLALI